MSALKLSEAQRFINAKLIGEDTEFTGVSTDSRAVNKGDLFVAVLGERVNGHAYIEEAKTRGAVSLLVSQKVTTSLPYLEVQDTVRALGELAKAYRNRFTLPMAAITGSCGKTTVKDMLASILAVHGPVLATKGNLNTDIGVPLTLLKLKSEHKTAVIEMGARKKQDIAYLMRLASPTVSLVTNVGVAHIEIFGSEQGILEAKGEIYQNLTPQGTAVLNQDAPDSHKRYFKSLLGNQKQITFGLQAESNITAENISQTEESSRFTLVTDLGKANIILLAPGTHNIQNALAASALAYAMGIGLDAIEQGLHNFVPSSGRLQFKIGYHGIRIIDDTYNANPISMQAALDVLGKYPTRKIFVMGDMFELGSNAPSLHEAMGQYASQLRIDGLFGVGEMTERAVQAFGNGGEHFKDKKTLITALKNVLDHNTTVLVKGSRGMQMEEVVLALMDHQHKG